MEDTNREVRAIQNKLWLRLSQEERFQRCGEMFALAKQIATDRAPAGLSAVEKKRFVFRELYGFELPELKTKK